MRQLKAFINKEIIELIRTKKMIILTLIFFIMGIFNTLIAWGTPKILDFTREELETIGMTIPSISVNSTYSWSEFISNLTMCVIVFIILMAGTIMKEVSKGTLVNVITKGMVRWKIIAAKSIVITLFWTFLFAIYFAATYFFNMVFWDNGETMYLIFSMFALYIVGIWVISSIMLYSSIFSTGAAVTLLSVGEYLGFYFLGLLGLNKIVKYLPSLLINPSYLYTGEVTPSYFIPSIIIISVITVADFALSILFFNKKEV